MPHFLFLAAVDELGFSEFKRDGISAFLAASAPRKLVFSID
jgi:hypothetical protein